MKNQLYVAIINEQEEILISPDAEIDVVKKNDGTFHLLINHESHVIELVEADYDNRSFLFRSGIDLYRVVLRTEVERLVQEMGFGKNAKALESEIKAPMPGLVLEVRVAAGDKVEKGDPLVILEAMKMENVISAAHEATIHEVKVTTGQSVEKGEVLLTFEE